MSVLVVVQARTGSSRFPRKVLADLDGQTMLGFMLDRIVPLADDPGTTLVVATSDERTDDAVATVAGSKGIAVVRGSERDVLGRFQKALVEHPADIVVRLTGDCPLMDPAVVRGVLDVHRASGADYTSNTLARTFPDGLDVEVMASDALIWAGEHATVADEREHVTPHLQRHPRRFQLAQHVDAGLAGDERWTVDTPQDLDMIRAAVNATETPLAIGWKDLLQQLGRCRPTAQDLARPVTAPPHRRGDPYHRRWTVDDADGRVGSGHVIVDEGGRSSLAIEGHRPQVVERVVRELLRGDLQVTELTTTIGTTT